MPKPLPRHIAPILLLVCGAGAILFARANRPDRDCPGDGRLVRHFSRQATPTGGNGQPVDGIEGSSREMLTVHIHAHLSLFSKGQQIACPTGLGFLKPFQLTNGFVEMGNGFYWLHTHDATGIMHIESPDAWIYTLGNFFDIWGQPLSARNVAGLQGPVTSFVDSSATRRDPRAIVLAAHCRSRSKWVIQ